MKNMVDRLASEHTEASRAAHDGAHDVLGRLLKPVTDGIVKNLQTDSEQCKTQNRYHRYALREVHVPCNT